MLEKRITFDSFIRGILSGGIIIGLLYLINYLSGVLLPFFIAWLIAYMIYPMVTFVQYKLKLKDRVASILVVLLTLIVFIVLSAILLIPPFIEEFSKLKEIFITTLNILKGERSLLFLRLNVLNIIFS